MRRSPFRVEDIVNEDLEDLDALEDDDGLGEDTDDAHDEPDPEGADFQGLMQMRPEDTVDLLRVAGMQTGRWRGADGRIVMPVEMQCRICGCTDQAGCAGGCVWAAPNLCSRCVS